MTLDDIPLFSMLKDRLGYLSERQRLIAENVANSDTPGYSPQDLKPFTIREPSSSALPLAPVSPSMTNPAHLSGPSGQALSQPWKPQTTADSETRMDGNQVVLEEEMMKMSDARMSYDAAIGFYQKSMNMIQTALKPPP